MNLHNATRSATVATLDRKVREALGTVATQNQLPGDLSDATACCVTTISGDAGFLARLFVGGGPKTCVAVLTTRALLWAIINGKGTLAPNGAHIRDVELRPLGAFPYPNATGLHVYGHFFRGPAERGSVYVAVGKDVDGDAFMNAVAQALAKT